jgi:hypothetical protein
MVGVRGRKTRRATHRGISVRKFNRTDTRR